MLNIVLFGPPGAGKGTQSERLIERYGLVHLYTGDIFRYHLKNETDIGQTNKRSGETKGGSKYQRCNNKSTKD